jgi:hypothetical protein
MLDIYCHMSIISTRLIALSNVTFWGDLSVECTVIWLDDLFLLWFVRK